MLHGRGCFDPLHRAPARTRLLCTPREDADAVLRNGSPEGQGERWNGVMETTH